MSFVPSLDLTGLQTLDREASVYEAIREDIISGRLPANARLIVADLAERHGTSTNPIREALHQLRGEGFVIMAPNRGARVRPIDEDFIRDIYEIEVLIEPALTKWFVGIATDENIATLEALHAEMIELNYADPVRHGLLDTQFHHTMYQRHYNRHAVDLWWKHREILRAISRRHRISLGRQAAVMREHAEVLEAIKAQDENAAAAIIARHVEGSGRHIIEQMRAARRDIQNSKAELPPYT
ncbi:MULTISPECIES: GntR family transcriptional regulator [Kaistia]|uniref:GntR family transcriptional regulator n=1 Tax=Kaistia nematophila TaxID=2994654 RepID=A0A9X3IL89_9HYPH|nr:GntR family transcriptional regulator [Kaistia nematophila]MBN9027129.1 GntR family transcriptional regulator [Hyphomicrobiales bacterium]MCX5570273.1 GntR family transcriptional regulator [Kaistia nematophila]